MEFDWDEEKAKANFKKHGVSFEEAELAFDDENAVEILDELNSDKETRYQIIRTFVDSLLFVAFTVRSENIRIISARKATAKQAKIYNEYNR